jgi:hypothetical protein
MLEERYLPKYSRRAAVRGSSVPRTKGAQMPSTVTISGAQRQVIRELVLDHLSGIGDIVFAVERGRHSTAERLGVEFRGDLRLMADLGWDPEWRDEADLTMPYADLAPLLYRLRREAEALLAGDTEEREVKEADEETHGCYRYGQETCAGLLVLLDELEAGR